jgi:hypothetical protein
MKRIKIASISLSILAGCIALMMANGSFAQDESQKSNEPAKSQVVAQTQSEKDVVLGYLHTRDKIITIMRGSEGSAFTVKTSDGRILDSKLNEKSFQAKYPTLSNQIKYGLAGNDATLRLDKVRYQK